MENGSNSLMSASGVVQLATAGPPVLLIIGLLLILYNAVQSKLDTRRTLIYSGIVAVFFGIWVAALPMLTTRKISVVTTNSPSILDERYALKPVRYRFGERPDGDLKDDDFSMPDSRDKVMVRFDLNGLLLSYDTNLETVIRVAQSDPQCFAQASRVGTASAVLKKIKQDCPISQRPPGRVYE